MDNVLNSSILSESLNHRDQFKISWASFLDEHRGEVILNNSQPRLGKTVSSLEYCENNNLQFLFITDSHKLIDQVEPYLKKGYVHFKGQLRLCKFKNNKKHNNLIKIGLGQKLCRSCNHKQNDECDYHNQFIIDNKNPVSILITKKQLPTLLYKSEDNNYDFIKFIIFDEKIEDGTRIEPVIPEIEKDTFKKYGVFDFYPHYEAIYSYKDLKTFKEDNGVKQIIKSLKDSNHTEATEKIYYKLNKDDQLLRQIVEDMELNDMAVSKLLNFFLSFKTTVLWMELCCERGYHPYFPKTYLEFAHELKVKYNATLTVLNASVKPKILEYILKDFVEFRYPTIKNKENILFYYPRACTKSALFETDAKGYIRTSDEGILLKNYEIKYTVEVFKLIDGIIEYCNNKGHKVGIITYTNAEILYKNRCDVVGHFQGVQGSNEFDDVDVLIVVGTFNLPLVALANKTYFITGNYKNLNEIRKETKRIRGLRTVVFDDEALNEVKEFKKDEEHEQALLRSGAHIGGGKLIFSFGYFPERVEDLFDRRELRSVSYKNPLEGSDKFTQRSITNLKGQMTKFFNFH